MAVSVYKTENLTFVLCYNMYEDVYRGSPTFMKDPIHAAHIGWTSNQGRNAIDLYADKDMQLEHKLVANNYKISRLEKVTNIQHRIPEGTTNKFSLNFEISRTMKSIEDVITSIAEYDVDIYSKIKNFTPTKTFERRTKWVDKIIPVINPNFSSFATVFEGKENFSGVCLFDANIDLAASCVADINLLHPLEAYYVPEQDCDYCYASRHHGWPSWKVLKFVDPKILKEDMKRHRQEILGGKKLKYLRVGARTEPASDLQVEELHKLLEVAIETNTKLIVTTKFNRFRPETARLAKASDSSIPFSIGKEVLELGVVNAGFTTAYRLEQAIKYKEAGVRTVINMISDLPGAHSGIEEKLIQEVSRKHGIPIQRLGARLNNRKVAREFTGMSWDAAQQKQVDFDGNIITLGYHRLGNNDLGPNGIHPKFIDEIEDKTPVLCSKSSSLEYCAGCGFYKQQVAKPIDQNKKPNYTTITQSKSRAERRRNNKNQEKLFPDLPDREPIPKRKTLSKKKKEKANASLVKRLQNESSR